MNKQITIRMPKELLTKWLAALRSGKYKQALGLLKRDEGYCCLGVLQMETDGQVEVTRLSNGVWASRGLPTPDWYKNHNIALIGHSCFTPYLPKLKNTASKANDIGFTFDSIADAIEDCAEGF